MGNACSSSHTKSDKDVRPASNRPRQRLAANRIPAEAEAAVGGGGETNANALAVGTAGPEDDDEDEEEAIPMTAAQVLAWLKLSAVSLVTVAGAFYLTRKMALQSASTKDWDLTERLASGQAMMSGVEAQQIASKWSPGCVDCSLKSMKTITIDNDQKNASKGAVMGAKSLHKAYAAGDDFAPPRVYHNYWAAGAFPSQYYSKSDTIKNYRFTRIFGW